MNLDGDLRKDADYGTLWDIVTSFGNVFEGLHYQDSGLTPLSIKPESELKHPKSTIKRAIATLILIEDNIDVLSGLITGYRILGDFYPDEVYNYFMSKLGKIGGGKTGHIKNTERLIEGFTDEKITKIMEQHQNLQAQNIQELEFLFYLAQRGEVWEKFKKGYEELLDKMKNKKE